MISEQFVGSQKKVLERTISEIDVQIRRARKIEDLGSSESENTQEFESLAENPALIKSLEKEKKDAQRALELIAAGNYSICKSCKGPIETGRLKAYPMADKCVECASKKK